MLAKALAAGLCMLILLVGIEATFAAVEFLRPAGQMIALLLYPGTALVLAAGNNRLDDLGFWAMALLINWLVYALIAFAWLYVPAQRRTRPTSRMPEAGSPH